MQKSANRSRPYCLTLFILFYLLSACQTSTPTAQEIISDDTPIPQTLTPAPASTPTNPNIPGPAVQQGRVWIDDQLPDAFKSSIQLPSDVQITVDSAIADVRIEQIPEAGGVTWIYALVTPFPSLTDGIELAQLQELWTGSSVTDLPIAAILVDPSTYALFEQQWGQASELVKTLQSEQILDEAWQNGETWAIVPFEDLEPRWKVLTVDGISPVRKDFDIMHYGLAVYFGIKDDEELAEQLGISLPASNRQVDQMTTVVMTGVTAMVRGTASFMEGRGMTYPAQEIGDWLRGADILHISNEVPFARNCPQPFDWEDLVFCSQTEYIELLEFVGADVIELTGDHFKDWGPEAMAYTIDLYKERGWPYYGGGINAEDARKPVLFEHNGNKIAFTGCNGKEEGYAGASETEPGAIHCDFDEMQAKVKNLVDEGYQPIVTFQHLEYYQYTAHPILQADFQKMADAGAVIVSGSQAHQPHAFEFSQNALMHYGLGNLFFDQTNQGEPPRTAFIDRHIFYSGRHISTELLTIYFVDYALSRPMTADERLELLKTVFQASDWTIDGVKYHFNY